MLVRLAGIVTLLRLVQPSNAIRRDVGDTAVDRGVCQAGAVDAKAPAPMLRDAGGNRDAGQVGAFIERFIGDGCDAPRNRVISAKTARILNESGLALIEQYPVRAAKKRVLRIHRYRSQAGVASKRSRPDARNAGGDHDVDQARAIIKRIIPDARNTGRNRDAGQAGPVVERIIPDARDGQAIDFCWNDHSAARPGVFGDGDGLGIGWHLCCNW